MDISTVVLPVAGQGTRLLPLTKATPKELMPVFDRPVLQLAVDEAIDAGARRLVGITHESKPAIQEFLTESPSLVRDLRSKGKDDLAEVLDASTADRWCEVIFVEQPEPLGLGHAVGLARDYIDEAAFGVILPDDCILGDGCLTEMASAYRGGHMIAAMDVADKDVSKYGIFRPEAGETGPSVRSAGLIEKPDLADAPSNLAAVGRYILSRTIFDRLADQSPGAGNEIQLTDAIDRDLHDQPLYAFRFSGTRFDCGTKDGLLAAGQARQAALQDIQPARQPAGANGMLSGIIKDFQIGA